MRYPFYGQDLYRRVKRKQQGAEMQDDWEKRMADQQRRHTHEDIGGGARFGEADARQEHPMVGAARMAREEQTVRDGKDSELEAIGKVATTFVTHLSDQVEMLPAGPPRAWLQGLVALSRAVAATAAELEGEP